MVVAGTLAGTPAPMAAWRAGACPRPAGSTHPMITSCTSAGGSAAASSAPRIAVAPSCGAATGANTPWKAPIGVRRAATMTTSRSDMVPPRRPPPWLPSIGAARLQAVIEQGDERGGDLCRAHRLILAIPVGNPVERAGQRERSHLRIARMDGAVLDALADEAPDAMIDLGLHGLHVAAHGRREVLLLHAHHAPAELGGDRLRVIAQHTVQALAGRTAAAARIAQRAADRFHSGDETLEQQLLLVVDVVVHRGLGNLEGRGDVIQRGIVI